MGMRKVEDEVIGHIVGMIQQAKSRITMYESDIAGWRVLKREEEKRLGEMERILEELSEDEI